MFKVSQEGVIVLYSSPHSIVKLPVIVHLNVVQNMTFLLREGAIIAGDDSAATSHRAISR